jgi:hypothetical protein
VQLCNYRNLIARVQSRDSRRAWHIAWQDESILPVAPMCRWVQFLIFRNLLDSTPKSDVSSTPSRPA